MRKMLILLVFVLALTGCAGEQTELIKLDEVKAFVSEKGYTGEDFKDRLTGKFSNKDLINAWGEPDGTLSGFWGDIWNLDEDGNRVIVIYYDNDGYVKDILVKAKDTTVFQAKILEIHDGYYLVEPVEGSAELNSADRITVPMVNMDPSLEPEVGDMLEIIYDGAIAESYPAQIMNVFSISVAN